MRGKKLTATLRATKSLAAFAKFRKSFLISPLPWQHQSAYISGFKAGWNAALQAAKERT